MAHPFDRYFAKHSHYPRVRLNNGYQRIEVEFAPGYTRIRTYPRGGEVYVLRSTWFTLLKWVIPLTRKWQRLPAEDHDVPLAVHEAYEFEQVILQEKRLSKKHRKRDPSVYRR